MPADPTFRTFDKKTLEDIREWAAKHYGFLKSEKSQPDKLWFLQAMNSPLVLNCIAEINATEFAFKKLDANVLKAKYKEQLTNFETQHRPAMEKAGISQVIIDHLHDIYKVRAAVPLIELKRAVQDLGFIGDRQLRVTRGGLLARPPWRALKLRSLINSENFSLSYKDSFKSNEQMAADNIRFFRGVRGFMNALEKGLTNEQYEHLERTMAKYLLTAEDQKAIAERVEGLRELIRTKSPSLDSEIKRLVQDYPPGTPQHRYMKELVAAERISEQVPVTALTYPPTSSAVTVSEFKNNLSEAIKRSLAKNPEKKALYEKFQALIDHATQPEEHRKLRLADMLGKIPDEAVKELFDPFIDSADDDALLNDVLNPHPLAARLWGDRVAWMGTENLHYTRHFEEGESTGLYKDVTANPKYEEALKSEFFDAPTLGPYPFNSALEEIQHVKLLVLAKMLGFNLDDDIGIAQFDSFCHNYDISPGELTLDRVHEYPPPAHTYEELPIIKFFGWDEADVPEDYPEYLESLKAEQATTSAQPH